MANENDMKTLAAVGLIGTESPVKSPVDVPVMYGPTEAEMQAWADLVSAIEAFDKTPGLSGQLARCIDALVDAKVEGALEAFADRIEQASGIRP